MRLVLPPMGRPVCWLRGIALLDVGDDRSAALGRPAEAAIASERKKLDGETGCFDGERSLMRLDTNRDGTP